MILPIHKNSFSDTM